MTEQDPHATERDSPSVPADPDSAPTTTPTPGASQEMNYVPLTSASVATQTSGGPARGVSFIIALLGVAGALFTNLPPLVAEAVTIVGSKSIVGSFFSQAAGNTGGWLVAVSLLVAVVALIAAFVKTDAARRGSGVVAVCGGAIIATIGFTMFGRADDLGARGAGYRITAEVGSGAYWEIAVGLLTVILGIIVLGLRPRRSLPTQLLR